MFAPTCIWGLGQPEVCAAFTHRTQPAGKKTSQKHHRIRNTTKTFTVKTTGSACLHAVKGKKLHSPGRFWEPLALQMYHVAKTAIQASPLHSYILRDPISKGSPQVHLGKCRDTLSSRPWLTMPFDSYIKDTLPTPSSAVPSEHRPEGGGGESLEGLGQRVTPKPAGRGGWAPIPHTPPLNWICRSHPCPYWGYALFWQQPLWKSIFKKEVHKKPPLWLAEP